MLTIILKTTPFQVLKIVKNYVEMIFYNFVSYLMKLQCSKFETISLWCESFSTHRTFKN